MAKAIMIQGAGSNVGKSMLVAGIARAAVRRGLSVAPFKPQNMSNNAAVTADGGEIGRAQALQAQACHLAPTIDMNPVLLKPETDSGSQVIVQGRYLTRANARAYTQMKARLLPAVLESFHRLAEAHDLIVVEGAGSPAEVNLRAGDVANMGFAEAANVPVVLIGDIDRGGVIAQLVGTHVVLSESDRARIHAFGVNKFRGDVRLFDGGVRAIGAHTGWPSLGVIPWFDEAWKLPAEDIMDIASKEGSVHSDAALKIAVPRLNRIANFDDLDPLCALPNVSVQIVKAGEPLPGDAHLVLIPGSKSTITDLLHFRAQGWDVDLQAHIRRGGHVLGVCGGYQMLGRKICDPQGLEGEPCEVEGLGVLDVETIMDEQKRVKQTSAYDVEQGLWLSGYEIHLGRTTGPDCKRHWLEVDGVAEGATSESGRVRGCYIHGLFENDSFRYGFLQNILSFEGGRHHYAQDVECTLERLASHIEEHVDMDLLLDIASEVKADNSKN